MDINLKSLSDKQLTKFEGKLADERARRAKSARRDAKKVVEAIAKKHGFAVSELLDGQPKKRGRKAKAKKPSPPKYRNPEDPNQTWTGKGRQPNWFKNALDSGTASETLEI